MTYRLKYCHFDTVIIWHWKCHKMMKNDINFYLMMSLKTFCFAYQMLPVLHLSAMKLFQLYNNHLTYFHTSQCACFIVRRRFRWHFRFDKSLSIIIIQKRWIQPALMRLNRLENMTGNNPEVSLLIFRMFGTVITSCSGTEIEYYSFKSS